LALALDEPKANDDSVDHGGIVYLIDKELIDRVGIVTVDYLDQGWRSGFMVSSEKPIMDGASCGIGGCSC
jgi:hypothetical protein